jgi:DNA polymerase-4
MARPEMASVLHADLDAFYGRPASSMGAQAALGRQRATPDLLRSTLGYLCDRVAGRLRAAGRAARTMTVRVRFPGMRSVTRSTTVRTPVCATLTLTEIATGLAGAALAQHRAEREVTLLAVPVSNIMVPALQLPLPLGPSGAHNGHDPGAGAERPGVDRSVDAARWGVDRGDPSTSGISPSTLCRTRDAPALSQKRGRGWHIRTKTFCVKVTRHSVPGNWPQ